MSEHSVLDQPLLERIRERAPSYDEDNRFFQEDLDELRAAGYLTPRPLTQMVADQRLLAKHAPATALGLGMHFTWMGVAQTLAADGDQSLQFVLNEAPTFEPMANQTSTNQTY